MTQTSVVVCRDPRGSVWQLGPLPPASGRLTLIGWTQEPEVDGGVPKAVATVLAQALTSVGRITFAVAAGDRLVGPAWSAVGKDHLRLVRPRGMRARMDAFRNGKIVLVSTRQAKTAKRLFDVEGFSWSMQGQIVLLSPAEPAPPEIGWDELVALYGDNWTGATVTLAARGIDGVMRPGVDGDVAGLLFFTEDREREFLATLEGACRQAGIGWSIGSEEVFAAVLRA